MNVPSLYDSLVSRDSFKELTKQNNPIAAQAARAAANADVTSDYEQELRKAQDDYNSKLRTAALSPYRSSRFQLDPEVTAAKDRLQRAAAAVKANKNKNIVYINTFNELSIKLEAEYKKTKGAISGGGVILPKNPIKPVPEQSAAANEKYDPNYANANNIWFPAKSSTTNNPQIDDNPKEEPIVVVQPADRRPTKFINRRPVPPKPKRSVRGTPKPLSRPGSSSQNTSIISTNTNLDGNPVLNNKSGLGTGPCPPGTTGRGIDYGCTDANGATFIA